MPAEDHRGVCTGSVGFKRLVLFFILEHLLTFFQIQTTFLNGSKLLLKYDVKILINTNYLRLKKNHQYYNMRPQKDRIKSLNCRHRSSITVLPQLRTYLP